MRTALPAFSVPAYARLLDDLSEAGYRTAPVSRMRDAGAGPVAYLRHDIDIHVPGVERVARVEAERGHRATFYVLLTQHYNPFYPPNAAVLREIVALGHEVGLHYDLTTYPEDPEAARARLDEEVERLAGLVGQPVTTVSMHQPWGGRPDPFRQLAGYVHPHDPRLAAGLLYVSDSCRAWRDESLLRCFGPDRPRRLLLLTHPEVWLDGAVGDRTGYLETVLLPNAARQATEFVDVTVRDVWATHPGPPLHDARQAAGSPPAVRVRAAG